MYKFNNKKRSFFENVKLFLKSLFGIFTIVCKVIFDVIETILTLNFLYVFQIFLGHEVSILNNCKKELKLNFFKTYFYKFKQFFLDGKGLRLLTSPSNAAPPFLSETCAQSVPPGVVGLRSKPSR